MNTEKKGDIVDLQRFLIHETKQDITVELQKEMYTSAGILDIPCFIVSLGIKKDLNQDYYLSLKGDISLWLSDARTLKEVSYPISLDFEEKITEESEICGRFLENSQNTLDILGILWENIVLEIPISYTESDELNIVGDGYQVNGNESEKSMDPRLAPLLELLDKEKE